MKDSSQSGIDFPLPKTIFKESAYPIPLAHTKTQQPKYFYYGHRFSSSIRFKQVRDREMLGIDFHVQNYNVKTLYM